MWHETESVKWLNNLDVKYNRFVFVSPIIAIILTYHSRNWGINNFKKVGLKSKCL